MYTDIEEKAGKLYFGAAGRGGKIYAVSLQNGDVIFAYDTGGTVKYAWHNGDMLLVDRKGDILSLDSETGTPTKQFELRRLDSKRYKLNAFQYMLIKDNKLYAVGHPNSDFYDFYALCIDL